MLCVIKNDNFSVAEQMSLRKEKEENIKTFCDFFYNLLATESYFFQALILLVRLLFISKFASTKFYEN